MPGGVEISTQEDAVDPAALRCLHSVDYTSDNMTGPVTLSRLKISKLSRAIVGSKLNTLCKTLEDDHHIAPQCFNEVDLTLRPVSFPFPANSHLISSTQTICRA